MQTKELDYNIPEAKNDIIILLTALNFQTPEINNIIGRLLNNKTGATLIIFVTNNSNFKNLHRNIRDRIVPLKSILQLQDLQQPTMEEYPKYLDASESIINKLLLIH
jgi:hypothetical protein